MPLPLKRRRLPTSFVADPPCSPGAEPAEGTLSTDGPGTPRDGTQEKPCSPGAEPATGTLGTDGPGTPRDGTQEKPGSPGAEPVAGTPGTDGPGTPSHCHGLLSPNGHRIAEIEQEIAKLHAQRMKATEDALNAIDEHAAPQAPQADSPPLDEDSVIAALMERRKAERDVELAVLKEQPSDVAGTAGKGAYALVRTCTHLYACVRSCEYLYAHNRMQDSNISEHF